MQDKPGGPLESSGGPGAAGHERVVYVMPADPMIGGGADEIDLREIWNVLWSRRAWIAGITSVFTIAGVAYALLATEWYRTEVLLAPAEEKSISGLAGQLGGLASLAGISVGGGGTAEPVAVLESREFARDFIEDLDLLTVLFADKWDAAAGQWRASDPEDQPEIRDAVKYFDEDIRSVSEDRKTGLVTLAIEWTDPETAAEWANVLVNRLNQRMRERALTEAERNVRYLQEEMGKTSVVSLQQSIGRLLESEMQKLMLARGNEEFAFRVIDPASPPKLRARPKRTLIVTLAILLGGMLSTMWVLVRHSVAGPERRAAS